MTELTFVRLHEINEWEGETWDFWLQRDGNEAALERLGELIEDAMQDVEEPAFKLALSDVEPESVVNKLVHYAADGYMAAHNKVTGTLTVPDSLGQDAEKLYKGGIRDFYRS
jgi:hypothetical protein